MVPDVIGEDADGFTIGQFKRPGVVVYASSSQCFFVMLCNIFQGDPAGGKKTRDDEVFGFEPVDFPLGKKSNGGHDTENQQNEPTPEKITFQLIDEPGTTQKEGRHDDHLHVSGKGD